MEIPDGTAGFLYVNGKLTSFANRKEYTFWNVFDKYEIKIVSMEDTLMGGEVTRQMQSLIPVKFYKEIAVGEGETCLLYYDNVMQDELSKGTYRYWMYTHNVTGKILAYINIAPITDECYEDIKNGDFNIFVTKIKLGFE